MIPRVLTEFSKMDIQLMVWKIWHQKNVLRSVEVIKERICFWTCNFIVYLNYSLFNDVHTLNLYWQTFRAWLMTHESWVKALNGIFSWKKKFCDLVTPLWTIIEMYQVASIGVRLVHLDMTSQNTSYLTRYRYSSLKLTRSKIPSGDKKGFSEKFLPKVIFTISGRDVRNLSETSFRQIFKIFFPVTWNLTRNIFRKPYGNSFRDL